MTRNHSSPNIAIVRMWEGLGNQLFQYSFARALKERNIVKVYIDPYKSYEPLYHTGGSRTNRKFALDNFCITLPVKDITTINSLNFFAQKNIFQKLKFYSSKKGIGKWIFFEQAEPYEYNAKVFQLDKNIYFKGWFQHELYFKSIRNILLKEIRPQKKILINSFLKQLLEQPNIVSIHIRRGDYYQLGNVLPPAYYKKAISLIKSKILDPVFLIFSDETQYAKKILKDEENTIFMGDFQSYKDYEELFIMSRCKHNIIANSTFSWWGSWLNQFADRIVISPKYWTSQNNDNTIYIPNKWIKI